MAWPPTVAYKVFDTRAIPANLMAYIATNQADALAWANGGSGLRLIQEFSDSVANRASPVYPSIAFKDDEDAEDYTGDILTGAYQFVFEVFIQSQDTATIVSEAKKYAKAIKSMIRNCPPATVSANTGADVNATVLESIETSFDEIKTNEMQNDFLQGFQLRMVYRLTAAYL